MTEIFLHPAITLPASRKVTFPGVVVVYEIVVALRYSGLAATETDAVVIKFALVVIGVLTKICNLNDDGEGQLPRIPPSAQKVQSGCVPVFFP